MPRICRACSHPQRHEIDAALIVGQPLRTIALAFGLERDAVHRHARNHLPALLAQQAAQHLTQQDSAPTLRAASGRRLNLSEGAPAPDGRCELQPVATAASIPAATSTSFDLLERVRQLADRAEGILAAVAGSDPKTALAAIREVRSTLETLARFAPPDTAQMAENSLTQDDWSRIRAALLEALVPFPEARIAAATALLTLGALA